MNIIFYEKEEFDAGNLWTSPFLWLWNIFLKAQYQIVYHGFVLGRSTKSNPKMYSIYFKIYTSKWIYILEIYTYRNEMGMWVANIVFFSHFVEKVKSPEQLQCIIFIATGCARNVLLTVHLLWPGLLCKIHRCRSYAFESTCNLRCLLKLFL